MVRRQASRPDNAVTVPRERPICTKQIHTYSERSSNALTTWVSPCGVTGRLSQMGASLSHLHMVL